MNKKLNELILYIAEECKDSPTFGYTKLNKILFISDFYAYIVLGKSITKSTYFHLQNGPAPKEILQAQDDLIEAKRAEIEEREYFGRPQKRMIPLKGPNISIFTQKELNLVKEVIELFQGRTAYEISSWAHNSIPWLLTEQKEEIPYFTAFTMFSVPVRRDGILWGQYELNNLRESGYEA